ncbi:MAG: 30S ribosomal protein S7 [Gammaproteobacteria bacterium]|nr:30S ribosomal protein S7 [Gammaproteobacteria bacterium]
MARRREAQKRLPQQDRRFNDVDVSLCINLMMVDGNKSISERIFYKAMDHIKVKMHIDDHGALAVYQKALSNVMPKVEVKSRRVGGATYQVPVEVKESRAKSLAIRWIIEASRKRSGKSMIEKFTAEILDAVDEEGGGRGRGGAIKKRQDTEKMAEANRAFAHYRW